MTRLLATTVALCTGAGLLLYGASSAAANTVALTGDGPVIIQTTINQTTPGVAQHRKPVRPIRPTPPGEASAPSSVIPPGSCAEWGRKP